MKIGDGVLILEIDAETINEYCQYRKIMDKIPKHKEFNFPYEKMFKMNRADLGVSAKEFSQLKMHWGDFFRWMSWHTMIYTMNLKVKSIKFLYKTLRQPSGPITDYIPYKICMNLRFTGIIHEDEPQSGFRTEVEFQESDEERLEIIIGWR